MHKIRLGVIGTGMAFERLHLPALQQLQDKYQIVAICDQNQDKLERWRQELGLDPSAAYTDYRQMLKRSDIDAFDILVPIESNFTLMETVAQAGKPIICEKPLAPTREQAEKARNLSKKYNVPILIAENYRYNEENNIIRDLVRTKAIGDVIYFMHNRMINFPHDMYQDTFAATDWRQHPRFPGGVIYDTGVHDVAALRHIFGAIESVHAFGVPQSRDFAPYIVIQANFKFKSGVIGNFSFCTAGQEPQRPLVGLRIFGTNGMIYLEEPSCGTINVAFNDGNSQQLQYQPNRGFYNELVNFYQAAVGNEPISVPPEMEFGDAETIFAILESIKSGKVVKVDRTQEYAYV